VQALAGVADQLGQAGLDVQVHVFQVELPLELAGLDLLRDLRHALADGFMVGGGDDALGRQHLGMRQAARDVGLPQALVEEHAGGIALDQIAHRLFEESGPGLGLGIELVVRGGRWLIGRHVRTRSSMGLCRQRRRRAASPPGAGRKRRFYRPGRRHARAGAYTGLHGPAWACMGVHGCAWAV